MSLASDNHFYETKPRDWVRLAGRGPRTGPDPCRLALSVVWRAAAFGRPPRDEALAGRLGLRPRAPRGPLPLVPRSDGRALRAGAPGGDRLGRGPVYVRGRWA